MKLRLVVSGRPIDIEAHAETFIHDLTENALRLSGDIGQPPINWEMRRREGTLLDEWRTLAELAIEDGSVLFLNPRAGVGGSVPRRIATTAALLLVAAAATAQDAPAVPCRVSEPCVSVAVGAQASLGGGADAAVRPTAAITAALPVASSPAGPRLVAALDLGALPGESLDLADVGTFKALSARFLLVQPLGAGLRFSPYLGLGFATRLPGDAAPRERTARWWSAGVRFAGSRGFLELGAGMDTRLGSGPYAPTGHARGAVLLARLLGVNGYLAGEAVLGLRIGQWTDQRPDLVLVGVMAGR